LKNKELRIAAFIEGGLVMLLEISMPIIVAPVVGSSLYIWSILISISVAALAIGYFLGGVFFSKSSNKDKLLSKLFVANALIIFIAWLLYSYQNYFQLSGSYVLYSWLLVCILLFVPLVIFGSTTPLIIQILSEKNNQSSVGDIYSLSTVGGIIFCLTTGFFLIPELGVSKTILIAGLLTFIIPFLVINSSSLKFLNKYGYLYVAIVIFLFFSSTFLYKTNKNGLNVIHHSEGINGQLLVLDITYPNQVEERILMMNRIGQTWVNKYSGKSVWGYNGVMIGLASIFPENSEVLLLGLGGGLVAKELIEINKQNVDAVELDERITEISKNYFGLNAYENNINFYNEDARRYIKKTSKKYDVVIIDIFKEISPSHALSKENFEDLTAILNKNGMIILNFNGFLSSNEGNGNGALINTIDASGLAHTTFVTPGNTEENRNFLHVLYQKEPNWSNQKYFPNYYNQPFIVNEHILDASNFAKTNDLITDDKPIMDQINRHAVNKWREGYFLNFTKRFKEQQNLPLTQ
jgi:spermidine synthase/uncharacterized membrane protein